jgi:metal-responsive CopG/Arc/MetJ family transcriptional regulator
MATKPVQISVDEGLLAKVDADPETRRRGRSAFIRSAIVQYLDLKRRRQVDAQIAAAYQGRADRALAETSDIVEAQEWPDD